MTTGTVLGYYGSKVRAAARIVDLLPDHDAYVEPYCGSLAVLLAKKPGGRLEVVNDLDQDLMTFWRVLREQPDDLERVCSLTPHSRAEYAAAWPITEPVDDLERARRVWIKLAMGRGGQLRPTGWRYHEQAHGRTSSMPRTLMGYTGRSAEHRELAAALTNCRAAVVLSGYHSDLYDELYDGWHTAEISAFTGQANGGRAGGERTEVLWSNRPLGTTNFLSLIDPSTDPEEHLR